MSLAPVPEATGRPPSSSAAGLGVPRANTEGVHPAAGPDRRAGRGAALARSPLSVSRSRQHTRQPQRGSIILWNILDAREEGRGRGRAAAARPAREHTGVFIQGIQTVKSARCDGVFHVLDSKTPGTATCTIDRHHDTPRAAGPEVGSRGRKNPTVYAGRRHATDHVRVQDWTVDPASRAARAAWRRAVPCVRGACRRRICSTCSELVR